MIVKLAVKKAALPMASTIRIRNAKEINAAWVGTRSSRPKSIAAVAVVKTPPLKRT